ncbi:MAG: hypothetical protein WBO89_02430 [Propionicimonas sp.]
MGLWLRRLLAGTAVGMAVALGPLTVAQAETVSPSPVASATVSATPSSSPTSAADDVADSPDVALDDTRTALVIAGAGLVALIAAIIVFVRR